MIKQIFYRGALDVQGMRSVKTAYREAGRCYEGHVALFAPVLKATLRGNANYFRPP